MANADVLLRSLLAKAYKMQDTQIDALLDDQTTDDAGTAQLTELDKGRIIEIKKNKTGETFEAGYKKAKADTIAELDQQLKEKFEIESEASGMDLVEEITAQKIKATGKAKEITEDDIKRHKLYQDLQRQQKEALKKTQEEWEQKYNEREANYKKSETFNTIGKKATEILDTLNPVLPGNAVVANTIRNTFLNELKGFDYDIQGDNIVILKDGKVQEDAHGHSIDFSTLVKSTASKFFEFKQNNGGGNAGNGKPGDNTNNNNEGGATYPTGVTKPTNEKEFLDLMGNRNISPADRRIISDTWKAENPE